MNLIDHYRSAFGNEVGVACVSGGVRVLEFNDEDSGESVLATVGMAQIASEPGGRATELILFAKREYLQEFAQLLADLAQYPSQTGKAFGWYHLVKVGAPVVEGSRLDALLLTFPAVSKEDFSTFQPSRRAARLDIVQVIPISEAERKYCEREGCESFEELLEASNESIIDPFRKSLA